MNTIQDQLTAAEVAIKSGNFVEAETLCRQLLTQDLQPEEKATALLHLSQSLLRRGIAKEVFVFAEEALLIAKQAENKEIQSKAYQNLGIANFYVSNNVQALEFYKKALSIDEELGNESGIATNLGSIGMVYRVLADYTRSIEFCKKALVLEEKLGNKIGIARNLNNIGSTYYMLSEHPNALEYYLRALTINQELDIKGGIASNFSNIGNVHHKLSNFIAALEAQKQALRLHEEVDNKIGMASNLNNIGNSYRELYDYTKALEYYQQALSINEQLDNKSGMSSNLGNIAIIYRELSDNVRALEYFQQALELDEQSGNRQGVAMNIGSIGTIYFALSDYEKALEYYETAKAVNIEINNTFGLASNLGNIANVYHTLADYHRALEYYQQSLFLYKEMEIKVDIAMGLFNIGSLYLKKDFVDYNPDIAENFLLESLAMYKELGIKSYDCSKTLADLYEEKEQWKQYAHYLKQYYTIKEEVQTEEAKKKALQIDYERKEAEREKQRAIHLAQAEAMEKLLYKTFPSPIVPRLKQGEELVAEHFPSISVLFADLVGFTKLSLSVRPETMIEMLNFIFTKFDTIIKESGGHRIRTMGDGYFAICGAPDLVENHQYKLAKAALKFMEDIILPENIRKHLPEGTILDIRIGLHCGEAVCGMVGGLEKWQYDAYGDTINTASRMESHGEAGKIHISEDFKNSLLDYDEFTFIPREPMFIKGKGLMNTYFLE